MEFEAQVLPLKRRATWAKRVLLDQYLAVTLPSIRGHLDMYLLGSLLLCFFHGAQLNTPGVFGRVGDRRHTGEVERGRVVDCLVRLI